ncbi:MAG: hypothetical protein NT157_00110 [Candidatus Micrarchaeota archaeon]|nr:hypothetical protein [Candidatus Micrarchaeota archaeon]
MKKNSGPKAGFLCAPSGARHALDLPAGMICLAPFKRLSQAGREKVTVKDTEKVPENLGVRLGEKLGYEQEKAYIYKGFN